MAMQVVEYSREGYKFERFLAKNQLQSKKLPNLENWSSGELSKSAKILLSKSIFYVKKHPDGSHDFFTEKYLFRVTFFVTEIF